MPVIYASPPAVPSPALSRRSFLFFLVFALAIGLRIWRLDLPFLETYNNVARQSIVASVARNFYERGFNFFYPEIDENGRGPYLYNAEMPFYSYFMAIGYRLVGGPKPWAARAVSVLFSIGTLGFIYALGRRLYDDKTALAATLFAAFSPLNVALSRSIQPEATMLCASVGALYAFHQYLATRRLRYYFISVFWMFLAIATKFLNAYLFIPIFYGLFRSEGFRLFREPKNYLYVVLSCLSFFWYWQMWKAGQAHSLGYYPYRYLAAGNTPQEIEHFAFGPYFVAVTKVFLLHILTPLGAVFFVLGMARLVRREKGSADEFVLVWLVSVVAMLAAGWKTVIQHSYYQIPLVPVCAFVVAGGLKRWNRIVWVFVAMIEAASLLYYYRGLYAVPEKRQAVLDAGEAADRLLPRDALVAASHESSAIQLYYAHRRGWTFSLTGKDEMALREELEKRRAEGAGFFVISTMEDLEKVPGFRKYLEARYPVVSKTSRYAIFDLVHPRSQVL